MRQCEIKIQSVITDKSKTVGILFLISLLLLGLIGEFQGYYVREKGVYILATIVDLGPAPRGYVIKIKYTFKNKRYETAVSCDMYLADKDNIGRRVVFAVLPNHPTMINYIDYAPDCLNDSPPEGWAEIPKCK